MKGLHSMVTKKDTKIMSSLSSLQHLVELFKNCLAFAQHYIIGALLAPIVASYRIHTCDELSQHCLRTVMSLTANNIAMGSNDTA